MHVVTCYMGYISASTFTIMVRSSASYLPPQITFHLSTQTRRRDRDETVPRYLHSCISLHGVPSSESHIRYHLHSSLLPSFTRNIFVISACTTRSWYQWSFFESTSNCSNVYTVLCLGTDAWCLLQILRACSIKCTLVTSISYVNCSTYVNYVHQPDGKMSSQESSNPILHVLVVGFHHKKGCQVSR